MMIYHIAMMIYHIAMMIYHIVMMIYHIASHLLHGISSMSVITLLKPRGHFMYQQVKLSKMCSVHTYRMHVVCPV
jgi:hypothetical protein